MSHSAGFLISSEPIETSIAGAKAWRIRYASRDVNGLAHESTGLVIAPTREGSHRPVLTWAHGTTGLGDAACPSSQPDPARELTTYFTPGATQQIDYGIPGVQGFIDDGWIVCATDYQGLGTPGMHQYIVNRTNARDAVNIAHAARAMGIGAGTQLGCMGWSQGGGTAAAVAELEAEDFGDLQLIGTVPMSPGVPILALKSPDGPAAAISSPGIAPDSHLVMMLCGFQAANPDSLKLSDLFTPLGIDIIEKAWNTQPVHHLNDTIARLFHLRGPILNSAPLNFDAWKAAIARGSACQVKPITPVLVCIDSFAGGTVVPVAWQQEYITCVKDLGGSVEIREYPHDDHFSLPASCVDEARTWLTALLTSACDELAPSVH